MDICGTLLFCLFFVYLGITAIIDSRNKVVYCYFNYITAIILGIYLFVRFHISWPVFIGFFIFYIAFYISEKLHITGGGDTEVFGVCYLAIAIFSNNNLLIMMNIIIEFLTVLLVLLILEKIIDRIRGIKQKDVAFCPHIMIAMSLVMICNIIS